MKSSHNEFDFPEFELDFTNETYSSLRKLESPLPSLPVYVSQQELFPDLIPAQEPPPPQELLPPLLPKKIKRKMKTKTVEQKSQHRLEDIQEAEKKKLTEIQKKFKNKLNDKKESPEALCTFAKLLPLLNAQYIAQSTAREKMSASRQSSVKEHQQNTLALFRYAKTKRKFLDFLQTKTSYPVNDKRKMAAASRPRVGGRFIKKSKTKISAANDTLDFKPGCKR